jgi:lipopolysaccharide export system protein LptA
MFKSFLIFLLLFSSAIIAQQSSERITVIGDSLVGRVVNGESIREVNGNVILKQGNVTVTCNKTIQNISRNEAELIGNVVVVQDSLTLKTRSGFYFGNSKKTRSTTGLFLDDGKVTLTADSGEYFFDKDKAIFETNVKLVDSLTTMTSDKLIYYKNEDRAFATGNVKVTDASSIIYSDTLDHNRKTGYSIADGNVRIINPENHTTVFSGHLENDLEKKYSFINKHPVLLQIDTTYNSENDSSQIDRIDTLIIDAKVMEAFRDSTKLFKAIDSVKILRAEFSSVNDITLLFRESDMIVTYKLKSDSSAQPVLWYDNSQLTGDSVTIYLEDNKIHKLDVDGNSLMLSQNGSYKDRFDQTSSDSIKMFFEGNNIDRSDFFGNVYSFYFMFDSEKPNGLTKSTSNSATIYFKNNEVDEVKLFGSPNSEYYPEVKVKGLEKTFTLPRFVFYQNRPMRSDLLKNLSE